MINLKQLLGNVDDETRERQRLAFERMEQERKRKFEKEKPYFQVALNSNVKREEITKWTWKKLTENDANREAWRRLRKWTPNKTWGLFIYGDVGSGKTHLLKGFQIVWALKDVTSIFFSLQGLANEFRRHSFDGGDINKFINKLINTDILIVDDIGAENTTEFVQSQLLNFLDQRILKGKSIFCSSNYSEEDLANIYDDRIMDRFQALMSFTECSGESYRTELNKRIEKDLE